MQLLVPHIWNCDVFGWWNSKDFFDWRADIEGTARLIRRGDVGDRWQLFNKSAELSLRILQCPFHLFPFCDVICQNHAGRSAFEVDQMGGDLHIDQSAIFFVVCPAGRFLQHFRALCQICYQHGDFRCRANIFDGHV